MMMSSLVPSLSNCITVRSALLLIVVLMSLLLACADDYTDDLPEIQKIGSVVGS